MKNQKAMTWTRWIKLDELENYLAELIEKLETLLPGKQIDTICSSILSKVQSSYRKSVNNWSAAGRDFHVAVRSLLEEVTGEIVGILTN